jgi:hypothetical protein
MNRRKWAAHLALLEAMKDEEEDDEDEDEDIPAPVTEEEEPDEMVYDDDDIELI